MRIMSKVSRGNEEVIVSGFLRMAREQRYEDDGRTGSNDDNGTGTAD